MTDANLLYQLVSIIVLLIPIGGLIWKAAKQSGKIETLETRVSALEATYKTDVDEIKEAISTLKENLVRIETSLSYIEKALKEEK